MRVLHVAAGNLFGGVEQILATIARTPSDAVRHAFAVCFDGRLLDELRGTGADVHSLGPVRFSQPVTVWRARRRLRRLIAADHQAPIVVAHSPWSYSLVAPVLRGHRRAVWVHNVLAGRHWTERALLRTPPDLTICSSQFTRAALLGWAGNLASTVVYAPVPAPPRDPARRANLRRALGEPDGRVVIAMASRFERGKGHADLLRAAATLRGDWSVWIAGAAQRPEESNYAAEIAAIAATPPLAGRVRLLGERSDVAELLSAADVLCQPNTAPEGFGMVFVEALGAGVPVVTSGIGGALEILTPQCAITVPPGDDDALGRALQRLVDDGELRRTLGAAGPARAQALCDPVQQVGRLNRALEALVTREVA